MSQSVWSAGLHRSDPRLRECFFHLRKLQDTEGTVDRTAFHRSVWICPPRGCGCGLLNAVVVSCCRCVAGFVSFILKALQGRFVIPDFSTFTEETQKLFSRCRQFSPAQVSTSCFSLVDITRNCNSPDRTGSSPGGQRTDPEMEPVLHL